MRHGGAEEQRMLGDTMAGSADAAVVGPKPVR